MKKAAVITAIVLLIAAAALLIQFSGTDTEYSRFNTNWNGTSDFFASADAPDIYDYKDLEGKTNTTLLVIAPTKEFGGNALLTYVKSGNTLIIADQSGNANRFLLTTAGTGIRVVDAPLRSSDWEYKDAGLIRGYVTEGSSLFGTDAEKLFVNYPGYVTGGKTILETSQLSWIDTNGNNVADKDEPLKVYSLAASYTIGSGKIIVISDPSIFVNSMQNIQYKENTAVLNALKEQNLLIDQTASDTAKGGGIFGLLPLIYQYPAAGAAILAGIFLLCGLICIRRGKP